MLKPAEVQGVLITPDQVAERIQIEQRLEKFRHPGGQIKDRHEVNARKGEQLYKVLDVPEVRAYRRQDIGDTDHGQKLHGNQHWQQEVR